MIEMLQSLRLAVSAVLAHQTQLTEESIRSLVIQVSAGFPGIPDDEINLLTREMQMRYDVIQDIGATLKERDFEPWLPSAQAGIEPYYWNRYRDLLIQDKGWSSNLISSLEGVTDQILGLMQNPKLDGTWDRRGLVIGHVQSGKTANYVGLVNKAADAGYKVIVIIAGIHNNLRNQTQIRVDEGFVGLDSTRRLSTQRETSKVGVGKFDSSRQPTIFTNSMKDFNKSAASSVGIPLKNLVNPAVFVIKKNSTTLRLLVEWLHHLNAQGNLKTINEPLLLIDDEADNASINTRANPGEVSRINFQIRELLSIFDRKSYVGYTATPFANIFIDPDSQSEKIGADLFPRDFIVSLDPPSNYFGPARVFADSEQSPIRFIEDRDPFLPLGHKSQFVAKGLPESLKTAMHAFVLARAIRLHRSQTNVHNSMLVHVSSFTNVQASVRDLIHDYLTSLKNSIRSNSRLKATESLRSQTMYAIHETWKAEYMEVSPPWEVLQPLLWDSIAPISVVEVNQRSAGKLNYQEHERDGLNVIAVGGNSLSRGLTLEGLSISYFLRNAKMYDTLMQMGRWFGYRPGYDDLCRVWMLEEAAEWYTHIADATEELRTEIRTMQQVGATPKEFGLRVRAHPTALLVTARNKMGSSERFTESIGLGGRLIESVWVHRDPAISAANRNAVYDFVSKQRDFGNEPELIGADNGRRAHAAGESGSYLFRQVPAADVSKFLASFNNHPRSLISTIDPILAYINLRADGELKFWDVVIPGVLKSDLATPLIEEKLATYGLNLICQRRNAKDALTSDPLQLSSRNRVSSRRAERVGLDEATIRDVEQTWMMSDRFRLGLSADAEIPDLQYRLARKRPLLMLHLLAIGERDKNPVFNYPIPAFSISFPPTATPEARVDYVVTQRWKQENLWADHEFEDGDEDEDNFG